MGNPEKAADEKLLNPNFSEWKFREVVERKNIVHDPPENKEKNK